MSDSLSSFPSGLSVPASANSYGVLNERVRECLAKLQQDGFSQESSEQIVKALTRVRTALQPHPCGQLLASELIVGVARVVQKTDHRNVEVLNFSMQQLAGYLADCENDEHDNISVVLPALNELAAMHRRPLISESLLTVPDQYRVDNLALHVNEDSRQLENRYLEFSQLLLGIQRGDERGDKAAKLSGFFEQLAELASDATSSVSDDAQNDKASSFWLACSAFLLSIEYPSGELKPAVFEVLKQMEKVVMHALDSTQRPVLGIQADLDRLLCNLLCYLQSAGYNGRHAEILDASFGFSPVLTEFSSGREGSVWIEHSVAGLLHRLKDCIRQLTEKDYEPVTGYIEEVLTLRQVLVVAGVHGAADNLQEVADYLKEGTQAESLYSATVSLELVEQQMLYQFGLLQNEALNDDYNDRQKVETNNTVPAEPEVPKEAPSKTPEDVKSEAPDEVHNEAQSIDNDFFGRCNACIDVIQHALDTALGSSGNLIPDNSVVSTLNKLKHIVAEEKLQPLTGLLTPLSQFLTDAENSTLNQAETLLVQEAIIAATLGIDSLVSQNPMPELITEVTERIDLALADASQRTDNRQSGSFHGFINEAEELQPRLFELFQRWRGAPDGASNLSADINRLLHTLKQSAEEVGQTSLASVVHYLESTIVDLRHTDTRPSADFFDLAIESVESLGDDIGRLRNSEPASDHGDLIDRLKLASGVVYTANERNDVQQQKASEEVAPAVIFDQQSAGSQYASWHHHFERVDVCYEQINHHHRQLVELQRKLETTLQNVTSVPDPVDVQLVMDEFAQTAQRQSSSIKKLDDAINGASEITPQVLSSALFNVITECAEAAGVQVRFEFSNSASLNHKQMLELVHCLEPLVSSIVRESIEDPADRSNDGKSARATIEVHIKQSASGFTIEVIDDGAGVSVQTRQQSVSPWQLASRAPLSHEPRVAPQPLLVSHLNEQVIECGPLIDFATRYGGSVAVGSDDTGTCYRISVPAISQSQELLLLEVEQQKFAIKASEVNKVASWNGEHALSLAQLIGLKRKTAFRQKHPQIAVQCAVANKHFSVLADKVLGHQSLEVSAAERLFPTEVPGYSGAVIDSQGEMVMVLDMGYWATQGQSPKHL